MDETLISNYSFSISNILNFKESRRNKQVHSDLNLLSSEILRLIPNFPYPNSKKHNNQEHQSFSSNFISSGSPIPQLPKHVIKNIIQYNDIEFIISNCLFLNRVLNTLIKCRMIHTSYKNNNLVHVDDSRTEIHSQVEIKKMLNYDLPSNSKLIKLIRIEISFKSRDQGWASADYSTSWVIAKFYKDNMEVFEKCLFENYKLTDYVESKICIDSNDQVGMFKYLINPDIEMRIFASCSFPGWQCYLKDLNINYYYIVIE